MPFPNAYFFVKGPGHSPWALLNQSIEDRFYPVKHLQFTQKEAANHLGVTEARVCQLVLSKRLPRTVVNGHPMYVVSDVERLRVERGAALPRKIETPRTEAAIQLAAFDLFEKRKTMVDVMRALDLTVAKVRKLYAEFLVPLGGAPGPSRFEVLRAESDRRALTEGADYEREQAERNREFEREREQRRKRRSGT